MTIPAIRVEQRGRAGRTWHYLIDDGRTLCGRAVAELVVVERADRDTLPPVEACHGCVRFADGWTQQYAGADRVDERRGPTLKPSLGSLRTTGPLGHGTRLRHGRRRLT